MSASLRTAIVDDEPLARRGIARLLADEPGIVVVGEAGDGVAAIELLEAERPDLVMLDVQMPRCDGFEVLAALDPATIPAVIFVTAHDAYAIRAFEVHAVDYLLKPVNPERCREALARVRHRLGGPVPHRPAAAEARGLGTLLEDVGSTRRGLLLTSLVARLGPRVTIIDVENVVWFQADGNYVRTHLADGRSHLVRDTMNALGARLDRQRFIRTHRSSIVDLRRVRQLVSHANGDYTIVLDGGARAPLSRRYRAALFERLKGAPGGEHR